MTAGPAAADRRVHRPAAVFDVRDVYRERQNADGVAAVPAGPVRFAVRAVVAPSGRIEPVGWELRTGRTRSGFATFADQIVDAGPPLVIRRLPRSTGVVEVRATCPGFQAAVVSFVPGQGQPTRVDLTPGIGYPFERITVRPGRSGPSLLRGAVLDPDGRGLAGLTVTVDSALYTYRTEDDGAWVNVLPDPLPAPHVAVTVAVPAGRTGQLDPASGPGWQPAGRDFTVTVAVVEGGAVPVPELRLRIV
uniref:hypothetical protein n=1 Tax=Paractinoplanes polyasparticus TaxID=2856853 RepID=UPI001C8513D4|nr:hypothetical protein [Actinoplanes polyasparticus]